MIDKLTQRDIDIKHLWHPYTDIVSFEKKPFPIIERANGVYLYEVGGRPLLDGISSWWCVNLGHGHPRLIQAICEQAKMLQHCILGGLSHPKAIELAERLADIAPGPLNHVFFASDGACAVEAALKIALQYWTNSGVYRRKNFVCLADGYHGDTLGAIGVGYIEAFHKSFADVIHPAYRACSPHCARCPFARQPETCDLDCFQSMEQIIEQHHETIAAVIVEPLCQGAAGIRIYPAQYLRRLRHLCDQFGLLLIADEIAVGFGRTGSMFACEHAGIAPDMMTVGKGLTGGYLPMSAAIVTDRIYDSFRQEGQLDRTLYHGHTFCGNPITSALALAALAVYEEERILDHIQPRIKQLDDGMRKTATLLTGSNVLTLGMIGVIDVSETVGGTVRAQQIAQRALELGLFIRPLGSAIYLWPPLNITEEDLGKMLTFLGTAVEDTA
jgi:adenosylmethionine-8-amino-7-oxononanoate aminotransferase